jgi:hypothetical protein
MELETICTYTTLVTLLWIIDVSGHDVFWEWTILAYLKLLYAYLPAGRKKCRTTKQKMEAPIYMKVDQTL